MNKKLFSFRLNEELMEEVREAAHAEGVSVTKLVEKVLERDIQQRTSDHKINSPLAQQALVPDVTRLKGADVNLLRDLLIDILFDREPSRGFQHQVREIQELKDIKEQLKNLEHAVSTVLKENEKECQPDI